MDVYSLGTMIAEILLGMPPFRDCKTDHEIMHAHMHGIFPHPQEALLKMHKSLLKLVTSCLDRVPERRCTMAELVYLEWPAVEACLLQAPTLQVWQRGQSIVYKHVNPANIREEMGRLDTQFSRIKPRGFHRVESDELPQNWQQAQEVQRRAAAAEIKAREAAAQAARDKVAAAEKVMRERAQFAGGGGGVAPVHPPAGGGGAGSGSAPPPGGVGIKESTAANAATAQQRELNCDWLRGLSADTVMGPSIAPQLCVIMRTAEKDKDAKLQLLAAQKMAQLTATSGQITKQLRHVQRRACHTTGFRDYLPCLCCRCVQNRTASIWWMAACWLRSKVSSATARPTLPCWSPSAASWPRCATPVTRR